MLQVGVQSLKTKSQLASAAPIYLHHKALPIIHTSVISYFMQRGKGIIVVPTVCTGQEFCNNTAKTCLNYFPPMDQLSVSESDSESKSNNDLRECSIRPVCSNTFLY